jgi:flagellar protein FlbD
MIELTTLAGHSISINPDQIRWLESSPDTIICFVDGTRLPIRETPAEIRTKTIEFKKQIHQEILER